MHVPESKPSSRRSAALGRYRILDTAPEQAFDDFTFLASYICGTPIALISLLDENRQWFKSRIGLEATETPIEQSFCAHAVLVPDEVMVVEDATKDARFLANPLVTADPNIRFYAGAPLVDNEGIAFGTLCVIDRTPRSLSGKNSQALGALARRIMAQLELRRASSKLAAALEEVSVLSGLIPMCAGCKSIRNDTGFWESVEAFLSTRSEVELSHSMCPGCIRKFYPEIADRIPSARRVQ